MEMELSKRIKRRLRDLAIVSKNNKNVLHRMDELQSLLDVLLIHTTNNGTLIEKITEMDGPLWKGVDKLHWLGQVVLETQEVVYHTFDYKGTCISPNLSNIQRFELSIPNYGE